MNRRRDDEYDEYEPGHQRAAEILNEVQTGLLELETPSLDPILPAKGTYWDLLAAVDEKIRIASLLSSSSPTPTTDYHWERDGSYVRHRGRDYGFTGRRADCIRVMCEARERGTRFLPQAKILEQANVQDQGRLSDLFKDDPAWKTLIVRFPGKAGHYGIGD